MGAISKVIIVKKPTKAAGPPPEPLTIKAASPTRRSEVQKTAYALGQRLMAAWTAFKAAPTKPDGK